MTIYIYLKTHNDTGFQYLGKTTQDPFKYKGSGIVWQRHLAKHGDDINTQVLLATEDKDEFRETALFFSQLYNVVVDDNFANLTEERGDGGATRGIGWSHSQDTICKLQRPKRNTENMKRAQSARSAEISQWQKNRHKDPTVYKNKLEQMQVGCHSKEARYKQAKTMTTLKWCNDGVRNYRLKDVPANYSLGRI